MSNRNRNKGHRLERDVARWFREKLGFKFAKTTREASRLLDSCKIDIANIPFLIQCKAGYENNYPKYNVIHNEIKEELTKNIPKNSELHSLPIILVHKLDGAGKTKPEREYWCMSSQFAKELIECYIKHNKTEDSV